MKHARSWSILGTLFSLGLSGCTMAASEGDPTGEALEAVEASSSSHDHAGPRSGDLLVTVASESATEAGGKLFRVKPDGQRRVISDFANRFQGPRGVQPFGVGVERSGSILVLDRKAGTGGASALFRVDPWTGRRQILSDFGNRRQGPVGHHPEAFSIDPSGDILVADENHAAPETALLVYSIDRETGRRRVVSDFGDASQGPVGVGLERVAALPEDPRYLLVTDRDYGPNHNGALFRVDRFTGRRVVVSDFGDASQGPTAVNPQAFVFDPNSHRVLVKDENEGAGVLLRVDYVTGRRTLVSTWADATQGPVIEGIEGISEDADGTVLGAAPDGGASAVGAVYRIHPSSGFRTLVTDFGDASQGPLGESPLYVTGDYPGSGELRGQNFGPTPFKAFTFTESTSTSGNYDDGDVRLDSITFGSKTLRRSALQTVRSATILIDDGIDATRGGHNFASGQGVSSSLDDWETEGPATITPTSADLTASLANFNLTSIVVTREAVGTASLDVKFARPTDRFFLWERGSAASPSRANSDVLVEALDARGRVLGAYKLLRGEYSPSVAITTWNGSFYSPTTPGGQKPVLGGVGLALPFSTDRLRLTSVQQEVGGTRDDGPDYKIIAAAARY